MKRAVIACVVLAFVCFNSVSQENKEKEESVKLYSATVKEDGFDITFEEVERGSNYSLAKIDLKEGTSVGSSMFIAKCFYDIANERQFEYMANGKEWEDKGAEAYFFRMYFTNDKTIPLKELLGSDYSEEAQKSFDLMGYTPVKMFDSLFKKDDDAASNN